MCERPDRRRVQDRAQPDRTAEGPADAQHRHLDARADQTYLVAPRRERCRETVARARAEAGPDVQAGRQSVQQDPDDEQHELERQLVLRRHHRHRHVDAQADHDGVGEGSDTEALAQGQPQQEDDQAGRDRPRADLPPEGPGQTLMQHVPRIDAQVGLQEQATAHPVGDEPDRQHRPARRQAIGRQRQQGKTPRRRLEKWAHPTTLGRLVRQIQYQSRVAGVVSTAELVAQLEPALGRRSAYLDLADGLRALIMDGRLVVGDRLPPQRAMADALKLSRTTVVSSLTLLQAEGFLSARQGSATTVCVPPEHMTRPDEPTWLTKEHPVDIDLSIAVLPAAGQVLDAAHRAADRLPAMASGPGLHPLGVPQLRAAVAERLRRRGLPTRPDHIVITQGALHGWDLILRTFARPGSHVLVEQPSYPAAIDAVRAHHAVPRPVAVTADKWQWPHRSDRLPDIAYVVPDFQNPTGHLADDSERRDLANRTRGSLLCVDETFAELGDDAPMTPVAALDNRVLTIGTLSKLVWAGLRIGWVRGPRETVNRLAAARSSQDVAAPVLDQLLALELMDHLDEIGENRRMLLRQRRAHAVAECRRAGWSVVEPSGGMFLWVDLNGASGTQLSNAVRTRGVRIPPGTRFSTSRTHDRYFRVPVTCAPPALSEAVRRMVEASGESAAGSRRPRPPVWTV